MAALAAPGSPSSDEACSPGAETLCLHDGRYEVRATWRTSAGESGSAQVVPQAGADSGLFRFFDAENWEILVKVLDACAVNDHYWVYAASTTDLGYAIRVTDTATGDIKEYTNEPGRPAPAITDAKAFPDSCGPLPPTLASPGSIAVEWGVWEANVVYDSIGTPFAADFDGDGDDDVLLAPAGAPAGSDPAHERVGVILLNRGDFTFEVAAGDRPRGVHPAKILMADFDGDGRNDFFVSDSGYDFPPFPGWRNQLLLGTAGGYRDATDRLPGDRTGYSHGAASGDVDGDGDVDILVANNGGEWIDGPYFLMNDGRANFAPDTERIPEEMNGDSRRWPWVVELADLDGDGHLDLLAGANGRLPGNKSFVYWGSAAGRYRDEDVTALAAPGFITAYGGGEVISTAVDDVNADGRPDLLLGGYDDGWRSEDRQPWRGVQLLVNRGRRVFVDETPSRLGPSAWSAGEPWHVRHRFFDFSGDGAVDIAPQLYAEGANVLAWLNDGTGRYAVLKSTEFGNADALRQFALGLTIQAGGRFKYMHFFGDGTYLAANAAVVVTGAVVEPQD